MSKIVFFSIPAYGHTNPTIEVVRELTTRGHKVWYYSFEEFRTKIEGAGAKFIGCDEYIPELRPEDEKKVGKDFSALISMMVDTTIALDKKVCDELKEINPDCIVSDSLCCWGKLFAKKLNITYICSTTSFAFNKDTASMLKKNLKEILYMVLGMRKINKKIELLRSHGYEVESFISLIENDNDIDTIVYTSKEFQPMAETFSDKYYFIGPSVEQVRVEQKIREHKKIYISLGTVNNKNLSFYKNCIEAFRDSNMDVIMSVGNNTDISQLGTIPANFQVENKVEQVKVLQEVDGFITHCGMNSVNESLYYGVPLVLFPQQSEQELVCKRVLELGAGFMLKNDKPNNIKEAVYEIINNDKYKENAQKLSKSFKDSGGPAKAADAILNIIEIK